MTRSNTSTVHIYRAQTLISLLAFILLVSVTSPSAAQQQESATQTQSPSNAAAVTNAPPHQPVSPFVRRILEDHAGNLWFGTNGDGVIRYDGTSLKYFSTDDRFSGVAVRGIVEDKNNTIWFGTEGGLTRYDGEKFTNYTTKDGLIHNDIWALVIDRNGLIWIGTFGGACTFDGTKFSPFKLPESKTDPYRGVSSPNIVHSIMQDSKGRMWFGTNGGAYIFDGKQLTNISEKDGLCNNAVNCILEDNQGRYWFATHHNGVCRLDGDTFTHFTAKDGIRGTEAWDLYKDEAGHIWFPIENDGVFRYDGKTFYNYSEAHGLTTNAIQCTYQDRNGRIWFGGWKGLFRLDGDSVTPVGKAGPWKAQQNNTSPSPALGETVADIDKSCWMVFQDKDNNYWFGSDGSGVTRYDGQTLIRFNTKHGLAHDQIRGIQQHRPTGHILITTNGGVSRFDGERFVTLPITELKPPRSNVFSELGPDESATEGWLLNDSDVWLAGGIGPRRYDGETLYQLKFPKSPLEDEWRKTHPQTRWDPYDVWFVYKDTKGHMWFGTGGIGVCRFDGQSLDWMFEQHLTEIEGGGWFGFRSIIEDKNGDYWICNTQFGFVMQPHGAGQEPGLITYQRKPGMDLSNLDTTEKYIYFQSIVEDNNRDLWMSPYMGGVWKWDGSKMTHYPLKFGDGPDPPQDIKMISLAKDNHGNIWVATQEHGPYKFNTTADRFERFKPSS